MKRNSLAQARILYLFDKFGGWSGVERKLGINRGVLYAVANGKRKPSRTVLAALGLSQKRISDMSTKELARLIKERT